MTAKSWKIQASQETIDRLGKIAEDLGSAMTANGVAAMTVFEISRVPAKDLWLALGAIRQFAAVEAAPGQKKLPPVRLEISR